MQITAIAQYYIMDNCETVMQEPKYYISFKGEDELGFVQKLERKLGKYAIHNLMYYIIILYVVGWVIQIVNPVFYHAALSLDIQKILSGQVWRLVTFIIMPPEDSSYIFMIFTLYLYYMLGTSLERAWGAFRFNLYFFMGVLFHIAAGFLIYFIFGVNYPLTTYYLNMSLFFAFALMYPNMELYLFFIIPIKIKWLALIDGIYFAITIFAGFSSLFMKGEALLAVIRLALSLGIMPLPEIAVGALVSLLNFVVFFFLTRNYKRYSPSEIRRKQKYKNQVRQSRKVARHKCDICGRTNETNPELAFRYCSKCEGNHEYCEEHIFKHEHIH